MDRILIFGGRGYIGSMLAAHFPGSFTPSVDIADAAAVGAALDTFKPTVVLNAAGKTGKPNVDWCEDHKLETVDSNVTGPLVLLKECAKRAIYWSHIGSGCIYDGTGGKDGFTEDDPPNFTRSFYSFTKATIDQALKPFPVLQLRLRMPFDEVAHPRNLLIKLRKYPRVLDVQNSLTYLPDFLKTLEALIKQKATGIYNMVNPGSMSPYQIVERYHDLINPTHVFERLTLDHLPEVVRAARSNCILSTRKLQDAGITLMPVEDAVEKCLNVLRK